MFNWTSFYRFLTSSNSRPKGIVTQLIVRLYRWIEQQQIVWRSGVVLNNGRARGEVIENYRPYRGEIRIRVSGLHQKEMLSIIAHEIDEINASFEKIKVTKKIPCICEECQDDPSPYFFRLKTLDRYLAKGRYKITCDQSCLDVSIRNLTAVLLEQDFLSHQDDKYASQQKFEQLKQQHTEYYPINIEAENVQIVQQTDGGDAAIHKSS